MDNTTILDDLFAKARTCESALAIALRVRDETTALASATRLRKMLDHARFAIVNATVGNPARGHALVEMFLLSTRGMRQLLQRNPITSAPLDQDPLDQDRLRRWGVAIAETKVPRGGPHLFELDSHGRDLQQALFCGLHVARSKFLADLRDSTFVDTFVEFTDFTFAKLDRAIMQRTCIRHSSFRDSSFRNAIFDDIAFFDCDLRDADLSCSGGIRGAVATTAQFIRCDLRGARCLGRDLSAVDFIGCQVHGMASDTRARSISRADVSANGDGSWVMGVC